MKKIIQLLCATLLILSITGCTFLDTVVHGDKIADFKHIDSSGVLNEQVVKGWLFNSPSRRVVVMAAHTGPTYGTPLTIVDNSGVRHNFKLVYVKRLDLQVIKNRPPTPFSQEDLFAGDTSIGILDRPAPNHLMGYNLAKSVKNSELVASIHQDLLFSYGRLVTRTSSAMLSRRDGDRLVIPGDSGLPWFNVKNEVVTHNTLGNDGHGPSYTHILINKELKSELDNVEKIAAGM